MYPEVCQAVVRKFKITMSNEDYRYYSNITGTEVLMALSDDEGILVIYDNFQKEIRMID